MAFAICLLSAGIANASPVTNFARVTVSTGYDAAATTIVLGTGHGAKLPSTANGVTFPLVWWNSTLYPDPTDDPNVEIVNVTDRSGDTLIVTRGFDGTAATAKNTIASTYKMMLAVTRTLWEQANPPDRLGITSFPDLPTAVNKIGSANKTLSIFASTTVTAGLTLPETLIVDFTAPGKIVCSTAGVIITINGPLLAGAQQIFELSGGCEVRLPPGSVVLPVWWGSKGDGITDDYAAVQAAWTAGSTVLMPCKTHAIGSTLTALNVTHFHVAGCGGAGGAPTDKTVFKWIGAAGGTLFKFTGMRDSNFERFVMTVGAAPSTLAAVIDFDPTGRLQAETGNRLKDIGIVQRGGATTPDGSISIGIRVSRSDSPGNVDLFEFDNVAISGCTSAAVSIEDGQSKGHVFYRPQFTFCTRGIATTLNGGDGGGGFIVYAQNMGNNSVADYDLTGVGWNGVSIYGGVSESSARLILNEDGSNASSALHVQGITFAGSGSLASDGQVIKLKIGGPVHLIGNNFYGSETAKAAKIGFNQSTGILISEGNTYNNTTPFVSNGGSTDFYSRGDYGFDGTSFVSLQTNLGAFGRDVAQQDVVNTTTQTTVSNTIVIPKGIWIPPASRAARIIVTGDLLNNTGGNQNNPAILIELSGRTIVTIPSNTAVTASANRYYWSIVLEFLVRANSEQYVTGRFVLLPISSSGDPDPSVTAVIDLPFGGRAGYSSGGIDLAATDQTLTVKITNATASANYSTRKNSVHVEAF